MNTGKYVFAQMMEYLPRYEFDKYVKKYNGNFHSRELLVAMVNCCTCFLVCSVRQKQLAMCQLFP